MRGNGSIALGIISRNRLGMVRQCINSAITNHGETPLGILVMFDDDPDGYDNLTAIPGVKKHLLHPRHYYVRAANTCYFYLKQLWPEATYFCLIDDDIEFMAYPWADELVKQFKYIFPDGMGLMDIYEYASCCQLFSTFDFVDQQLGGYPYDWTYTQFYHDEVLRHKMDDMNTFACPGEINGNPVVVHKRDPVNGAIKGLKNLKLIDYKIFEAQAKENGWSMYRTWVPQVTYDARKIDEDSSHTG
jgi:hypothetical protein